MVIISGRHDSDLLNEKAVSVLDFVVNAQVCEGEIETCLLGIIIKAKHHSCGLLWKVELASLPSTANVQHSICNRWELLQCCSDRAVTSFWSH